MVRWLVAKTAAPRQSDNPQVIEILDLGISNVASVRFALSQVCEASVSVICDSSESRNPRLFVLPGNGNFGEGMSQLEDKGFLDLLQSGYNNSSFRLFGICLGMQLLGRSSSESPHAQGMGFVDGVSLRLNDPNSPPLQVPRIGWAPVAKADPKHFQDLDLGEEDDVFFSHSYHLAQTESLPELLVSKFGGQRILAGFRSEKLFGLQFHPEKSSATGLRFLRSSIDWAGLQ